MEDAHSCILDLRKSAKKDSFWSNSTADKQRMSFFGVYDGHGGDTVALFAGEHLPRIILEQDTLREGNIERALQDAFLATDRAILKGTRLRITCGW